MLNKLTFYTLVIIISSTVLKAEQHYGQTHGRYAATFESNLYLDMMGVQIPKYEDRSTKDVLEAATNYFVNQLGHNGRDRLCVLNSADADRLEKAFKTPQGILATPAITEFDLVQATGSISHDWDSRYDSSAAKYCIDAKALHTLVKDYPYECRLTNPRYGHTVTPNYRLDFLIYRLMDQEFYHEANQIPKDEMEVLKTLGDNLTYNNANIPRTVIKNSIVTQDYRAIGLLENYYPSYNYPGIPIYHNPKGSNPTANTILTFDFNKELKKKARADFKVDPINTDVDAIEAFLLRRNGLWDYLVFDIKKQQRLDTAPGGVADFSAGLTIDDGFASVKAHKRFNSIRNGIDCMTCHTNGIQSGVLKSENKNIIKALKERVSYNAKWKNHELERARILYDVPASMEELDSFEDSYLVRSGLPEANKVFQKAMKLLGVNKKGESVPLLPDFHAIYAAPLDLAQAAAELGTTESFFKKFLQENERNFLGIDKVDPKNPKDWSITRETFEKFYCHLYEELVYQDKNHVHRHLAKRK